MSVNPSSDRLETMLRLVRRTRNLRRGRRWPYVEYGRRSYGGEVVWHEGDPPYHVRIGDYTSIAGGVEFMIGGAHRPDWVSMFPFRIALGLPGGGTDGHPASKGDIVIGSDVWIGRAALVLSGVTIGDGAVVASRSVVTGDVPPYAIVAGSPARLLRLRFPEDQITALLDIRWWEWPEAELIGIVDLLNGADVAALIEYARRRSA